MPRNNKKVKPRLHNVSIMSLNPYRMCMQAFVQDNGMKTTLKLVEQENSTYGKKEKEKIVIFKAKFDLNPLNSSLLGDSVDLLASQSYSIQHVSADIACVLREESHHLPVDQGQRGLVSRSPNTIPGSVERVGHSWTQHVVQVHLSDQA